MKPYTPDRHIETALTKADARELDLIELFFFAYRDFTADPDLILEKLAFGRALAPALGPRTSLSGIN